MTDIIDARDVSDQDWEELEYNRAWRLLVQIFVGRMDRHKDNLADAEDLKILHREQGAIKELKVILASAKTIQRETKLTLTKENQNDDRD